MQRHYSTVNAAEVATGLAQVIELARFRDGRGVERGVEPESDSRPAAESVG
jgi:hypothetical protein